MIKTSYKYVHLEDKGIRKVARWKTGLMKDFCLFSDLTSNFFDWDNWHLFVGLNDQLYS